MKNNKGFTFIEMIVAVVLLGIIVVAFSGVFISSSVRLSHSGKETGANAEARKIADGVLAGQTSAPEVTESTQTLTIRLNGGATTQVDATRYKVTVPVEDNPALHVEYNIYRPRP